METAVIVALLALLAALGAPFITSLLNRKSPLAVNTETIAALTKQVRELATDVEHERERNDILEERVDKLQSEVRKFRNGYARAIRWINEKGHKDVPDFLMDTQDLGNFK